MKEQWRFIAGCEGIYEISNHGHLRTYIQKGTHRIMSCPQASMQGSIDTNGYLCVILKGGRRHIFRRIHRLVLEAFVGPCPEGLEACHIDGSRRNNRLGNLEWNTHRANQMEYGGNDVMGQLGELNLMSKLTISDIGIIRERASQGETHAMIAKDFPVQRRNITRIINKKRWAHV